MSKKKQVIIENITLGKLVHGGQCIAHKESGKTVFVWGGLPGETVNVRVTKKKSSYIEAIVTEVLTPSVDRIEPVEPLSYLSTSPWQIMTFSLENKEKQNILEEAFNRESVDSIAWKKFIAGDQEFGYRNKQEYGFWGDDTGLQIAHYVRGTKGKQIVEGSVLADESINQVARDIRDELQRLDIWAGKLKTVLIRVSQSGEVVAALFLKEKDLNVDDFNLPSSLKGIEIYYSDPLSPASVPTKKLYSYGNIHLQDQINGKEITYDVMSFFQVNIPVFEQALGQIKKQIKGNHRVVDMYSGVGAIGIAVGADILIESDAVNIKMAKANSEGTDTTIVHAKSEAALDHILADDILIIDPPRAGLHSKVIDRILEIEPSKIIYLSCNPSTQARDIKFLSKKYNVTLAQGYNFFPRTPHIESLIVLERDKPA